MPLGDDMRVPAYPQVDKTFYSRAASGVFLKILLAASGIAKGILLARFLGPAGRGTLGLAASALGLCTTAGMLGQDRAVAHFTGASPERANAIFSNIRRQVFFPGVFLGLCAVVVASVAPSELGLPLALLLGSAVPLTLWYQLSRNLVLGFQNVFVFNGAELIGQVSGVALLLACGLAGVLAPAGAFLVAIIFPPLLAGLIVLRTLRTQGVRADTPDSGMRAEMAAYGRRAYLLAAMLYLINEMNIFFVAYLLDASATGFYALARRTAGPLAVVSLSFSQLLLPYLSAPARGAHESWRAAKQSLLLVALMQGGIAAVLAYWIEPIIEVFYGSAYLPAAGAAVLVLAAGVCGAGAEILIAFLAARKYPKRIFYLLGAVAVLQAALTPPLIGRYGVNGAALSFAIAQAALLCGAFVIAKAETGTE